MQNGDITTTGIKGYFLDKTNEYFDSFIFSFMRTAQTMMKMVWPFVIIWIMTVTNKLTKEAANV